MKLLVINRSAGGRRRDMAYQPHSLARKRVRAVHRVRLVSASLCHRPIDSRRRSDELIGVEASRGPEANPAAAVFAISLWARSNRKRRARARDENAPNRTPGCCRCKR